MSFLNLRLLATFVSESRINCARPDVQPDLHGKQGCPFLLFIIVLVTYAGLA